MEDLSGHGRPINPSISGPTESPQTTHLGSERLTDLKTDRQTHVGNDRPTVLETERPTSRNRPPEQFRADGSLHRLEDCSPDRSIKKKADRWTDLGTDHLDDLETERQTVLDMSEPNDRPTYFGTD